VLAMTAMAPQFAYILNRKLQPDSNVLRINIQHVMKGSYASEGSHTSRMAQLRSSTGWQEFLLAVVSHQMSD